MHQTREPTLPYKQLAILVKLFESPSPVWQRHVLLLQHMARAGLLPQGRFLSLLVLHKHWHAPVSVAVLILMQHRVELSVENNVGRKVLKTQDPPLSRHFPLQ